MRGIKGQPSDGIAGIVAGMRSWLSPYIIDCTQVSFCFRMICMEERKIVASKEKLKSPKRNDIEHMMRLKILLTGLI